LKNLFYAALFLFSNFAFGQITFENGYFINDKGEKTDVLIKNYDWKNNPSIIEYKTNETGNLSQIKTSDLQEFYVGGQKYITATVMIDRSSNRIDNLSTSKNFDSNEEKLLLKLIVEGKINLYRYTDGSVTRFFYKKDDEDTYKPLDYKEYLVNNTQIQKNEEYKNQLRKAFSDNENINAKDIEKLTYREDELKKIFRKYNNLNEVDAKTGSNFHIYIKPGIGFSNYKILPPQDNTSIGENKSTSVLSRIAAEFEYVLNFNKGKWAIFSEPSFQAVKFTVNNYNKRNFEVKYSSIQVPLGLKYNMFLNQKSKIYVSASLYYDFVLNKDTFTVDSFSGPTENRAYRSFAVGYNYDKFGVELKWGAVPYFSSSYYGTYHDMTMDGFNLSVSYKLF
jgi:hypothetical protein